VPQRVPAAQTIGEDASAPSATDANRRGYEAYVRQDYATAFAWFRKAADQGDGWAQYQIGRLYWSGQIQPRDYAQALIWFRKAADQGFFLAEAMLGGMYFDGNGVKQDYALAMMWLRKAAEREISATDPSLKTTKAGAQFFVGRMYEEGLGVARDTAQATAWYGKAAGLGHAGAKVRLAQLQEASTIKPETLNFICRNPSGITPIFIGTAARLVRIETGHPMEFRDGKKYYVRVTNDLIEFGCRTLKTDGEMVADGMAWLLGDNSKGPAASDTACLSRHRIDRHTGIWTASRTGAATGPVSDRRSVGELLQDRRYEEERWNFFVPFCAHFVPRNFSQRLAIEVGNHVTH
jgi:Sel1 repeat-containing protein